MDNLRPGLLVDGRYKLTERIPRWVASRRFVAEARSERLQVLFFSPDQAPVPSTPDWTNFVSNSNDPFWLKPIFQGEGAGFVYLGLPLVRGPSLRQMLDEGRPWFCEDAARFIHQLVRSLRPLAEAGMELPVISPETLLVGREGRNFLPSAFPFFLPGWPPENPERLPENLRAILYELVARRTAPNRFDDEALAALPAPARNKWHRVFTDAPSWEALEHLPSTTQIALPEAESEALPDSSPGKLPLPRTRRRPLSSPSNEPAREIKVATEPPGSRKSSRSSRSGGMRLERATVGSFFSGLTGLVAVVAMVWFSWHLVGTLLHAENIWTSEAQVTADIFTGELAVTAPDPANEPPAIRSAPSAAATAENPPPPPSRSSNATSSGSAPARTVSLSLSSPPPGLTGDPGPDLSLAPAAQGLLDDRSQSTAAPRTTTASGSANFPQDAPGKIGSALTTWQTLWARDKENRDVERAYADYLEQLARQTDSLRSGRLPGGLQDLEKSAEQGFAPARFLLAEVLWGRDSRRSESLMTELAREGYGPARAWCRERNIPWD